MPLHVTCQCQLTARGREELERRQIPFVDTTFQCDCGSEITLPVPISPNDESRFQVAFLLQQALRYGALDYLFSSMHSRPSPENPEHGSSVLSALEKWSWDDDLRERINAAYQASSLLKMCMFSGIRLRALLSLFHHSFTTCYESFHTFMEGLTAFKDANLDERALPHWVTDFQLAGIMTWAQIAIAKFIAGEDDQRYANIRRDIASHSPSSHGKLGTTRFDLLDTAGFLSFFFPIQFLLYDTSNGFMLPTSPSLASNIPSLLHDKPTLNTIALTILIISPDYINKTVITSSEVTFVKVRNKLPAWVQHSVQHGGEILPYSAMELVQNWDDDNNEIFDFIGHVESEKVFRDSLRG